MDWMELLGLSGIEDFQQVELKELAQLERKHRCHVLRASRRAVAAVLATAMLLPAAINMTTPVARAADEKLYPPQATRLADGTSPDDPHIEIESNLVRDKYGFLTNTLELGIRVQSPMVDTGTTDTDGNPVMIPRPVQAVSVNLAYNAQVLHPVSWEWKRGNSAAPNYDVTTNVDEYYGLKLETQKDSRIQTAAANTGIVADPVTAGYDLDSQNVIDGKQGLVHFAVRAYAPEAFEEMTTLAVIRFAVDDALMEHLTLRKDGENYKVLYDGAEMADLVALQTAMTATAAAAGEPAALALMEFPLQKDIEEAPDKAASLEPTLLHYSDEFTEMNYIPDFDPADATMVEQVKRPVNGADYTLDRPNTAQSPSKPADLSLDWDAETLTLARKETAAVPPATDPTVEYSYTTNLIHTDNVKFTLVSKETFLTTVDEDQTVLVYVDWDNRILGTQIVPKNKDLRKLVSDHVAEHFIYHDGDDSTFNARFDINDPAQMAAAASGGVTAEDVVSSLERKDSYRGKYPATDPMGLNTDGSTVHDSPDTVVDEMANMPKGSKYALTNKLDYVFFKRPMVHTDQTTKPDKADPKYDATNDPDGSQYKADYEAWYFAKTEWSQKTVAAPGSGTTTPGGGTGTGAGGTDAGSGAAVIDDGDGSGTGTGTGTTTPAAGKPYWDTEHPYAYGWAQCTVDNYEDVWTTLGMGELGSKNRSTEINSLAYQTNTAMGYSGASLGGYQDLSTGANPIASVTYDGDAAFAFADLEKGFTQDEVFLKAVYEPGEDLANTMESYSMISKPYYNKLNSLSASEGAAYSSDVTFERAATVDDLRVGVARMREPYVRQDVTYDQRWITSDAPKVDHDLANADMGLTYTDKYETMFIQVNMENVDKVDFSLTLSPRQNKIDYYLKDGYGVELSYVSGGERSDKDSTRDLESGEKTLDNYNYYVKGESDETDKWYDAVYDNRDGSRGFVLYGTLNQFLKMATQANRGEITAAAYEEVVNLKTLKDANLYKAEGKEFTIIDLANVQQYIRDAADLAETAHNANNDTWWNTDHDWAELTYHQLQGYLIQRTLSGSTTGVISHPETPLAALTWCHLHADCAAASSNAPTDWAELIDAARNNPDYIDLMTQATAEKLAKLRKDRNGTTNTNGEAFTSLTDFKTVIVDAVKNLDAAAGNKTTPWSWNDVQKQILIDQGDAAAAADDPDEVYWWYDGSTTAVVDSFAKLLQAVKDATDPDLAAPDGDKHPRDAKLNQLEKAYTDNKTAANASYAATDPAWVKGTENLAITDTTVTPTDQQEGRPFASFDDFKDAAKDAYELLKPTYENPDWYQLQYVILHYDAIVAGTDTLPLPQAQASGGLKTEYDGYWWHNGGISIKNLTDLLTAANNAVNGNTGALDGFDETALYDPKYAAGTATAAGLGLRKDFAGAQFTTADINDLREYAKSYSQIAVGTGFGERPSDPSKDWDTFQYYIIHGGTMPAVDADRDDEAPYYWWKNGGDAKKVDFTTFQSESDSVKRADALAAALLDAAFRASYNGNTVAWDDLTAAAVESGRLVKGWAGTEAAFPKDFSDKSELLTAADLTDLKDLAVKLMQAKAGNAAAPAPTFPAPTVSWETIQYALLNAGAYDSKPSDADGYWWKKDNSKGSDPAEDFKKLHVLIEDVANIVQDGANMTGDPSAAIAALQAFMTPELLKNLGFTGPTDFTNPPTADELSWIDWSVLDFTDGVANGNDGGYSGECWANGHFELTWYQLQEIIWFQWLYEGSYAENDVKTGASTGGIIPSAPSWVSKVTWPITSTTSLSMFSANMMKASNAMLSTSVSAPNAGNTVNEANRAKQLAAKTAAISKKMGNNAAFRQELKNTNYSDELIHQLAQLGYDVSGLKLKTDEEEKKDVGITNDPYQIAPDAAVKDIDVSTDTTTTDGASSKDDATINDNITVGADSIRSNPDTDDNAAATDKTVTDTGLSTDADITNDANVNNGADNKDDVIIHDDVTIDDNATVGADSVRPETNTDAPPATGENPVTDIGLSTDADTADDNVTPSAADPPALLESVTDFRNPREGPPRFGDLLSRSRWLQWQQDLAPITLLSRRTLA